MTRVGEGYVGIDIHRPPGSRPPATAARCVVSDDDRGLVGDSLPARRHLRGLGEHRLKDFPEPERLSQLVIEGLAAEFPPLRIRSTPGRTTCRPSSRRFVGRERELAEAGGC